MERLPGFRDSYPEPLPKPAEGRCVRHGFVRVKLHELLEAQPVFELLFGLGIAQDVEVLQNHDAQQHADTAGRAAAVAVGGGALLNGSENHFTGDGFQNSVGAAASLHGQIKEGRLVVRLGCMALLIVSPRRRSKGLLQRFPSELTSIGDSPPGVASASSWQRRAESDKIHNSR